MERELKKVAKIWQISSQLKALAYQPPASSTFLSEQTSHQQPASSTFLSEQTSHQPPAKRTGCKAQVSCFIRAVDSLLGNRCEAIRVTPV
jgi:hypothetical protein